MSHMDRKWWKEAVGYQIFPRSFKDTTGDGNGDIRGIIEKLDYLKNLGINMIWICPFYKSPMDDNGYDISDYFDINPLYGQLDDFKELVKEAHERGIKIIADLVMNQTSDEHAWFMEARKSKDNPYREFYIWQDGKKDKDGNEIAPTNWASFFGGSAWKKDEVTGQYFMKIFSDKMPDLNWESQKLRRAMYDMATWWLELGVDGFRVDAISHLVRDTSFTDAKNPNNEKYVMDTDKFSNREGLHDIIKEFNKEVLSKYDCMTVGEVGGQAGIEHGYKYAGFDSNEFNMVFNFDHNFAWSDKRKFDLVKVKREFNKWATMYGIGWNPLYWLNHDHPRIISHFGNDDMKWRGYSAKGLATALYFMWGTPFIYQGEEIGMSNYPFKKQEDFQDVSARNAFTFGLQEGKTEAQIVAEQAPTTRDNAKIMMQWDSSENAGFSTAKPWYNVHPEYKEVNVEAQIADPDSILNYYTKVNYLRRFSDYKDLIVYGTYTQLLEEDELVYAYIRELNGKKLLIIVNMFEEETTVNLDYDVVEWVIGNYTDKPTACKKLALRPYEAVVFEIK